ncbi:hypothetical protein SPURM210S_01217 [Streptomyces purpurascens]
MHDDRSLVEARLKRVLDERVRPAVYPESVPLEWPCAARARRTGAGRRGTGGRARAHRGGRPVGCSWGTSWFRVTGTVPEAWAGKTVEAILDLGFDENMPGFQCEGLVYRPDGTPVRA